MKIYVPLTALLFIVAKPAFAQNSNADNDAYTRVITKRSQKIVDQLHINDTSLAHHIRDIIVMEYRNIGHVHDTREVEKKAVKEAHLSKAMTALRLNQIDTTAYVELEKYHRAYLAELSAQLTPEQVITVKNAMTYNILPITYKGYLDMIPNLTAGQKVQIMAYLIEAREYAMDGGSSEEKHWWFGKYKGKINNYLSKEGYNVSQEEKAWQKRRVAAKNNK